MKGLSEADLNSLAFADPANLRSLFIGHHDDLGMEILAKITNKESREELEKYKQAADNIRDLLKKKLIDQEKILKGMNKTELQSLLEKSSFETISKLPDHMGLYTHFLLQCSDMEACKFLEKMPTISFISALQKETSFMITFKQNYPLAYKKLASLQVS